MNIASLIKAATDAAQLAGSEAPAFKTIMGQIKVLLGPADQKKLDAALAAAELQSDQAHGRVQDLAAGRP